MGLIARAMGYPLVARSDQPLFATASAAACARSCAAWTMTSTAATTPARRSGGGRDREAGNSMCWTWPRANRCARRKDHRGPAREGSPCRSASDSFTYIASRSSGSPRACRFEPSCSRYTEQAIVKYGLFRAAGWAPSGSRAATLEPRRLRPCPLRPITRRGRAPVARWRIDAARDHLAADAPGALPAGAMPV